MDGRSIGRRLVVGGAVLWMFAVLGAYYAVHKPFDADIVLGILRSASDLLVFAAFALVAGALGYRCTRRVGYGSRLEAAIFSAAVGSGIVSIATLILGLAGLLYSPLFWGLMIALGFVLRREIGLCLRRLKEIGLPTFDSRLMWFLVACLVVILLLSGLTSFAPPTAWDSRSYHLVGPKIYIQNHRIVAVDHELLFGLLSYPSLTETLYVALMLLKSDVLSGLLHFSFFLMTLLALYAFARSHFSAGAGWLAMVIFCSGPATLLWSTWAYSDSPLAFYGFCSLWAYWRWHETGRRGWLILAGLSCGLAMGVKYTSASLPIALGFMFLLEHRRLGWRAALKALLIVGLVAAVAASPWYLKNLAFTGNPFYPYLSNSTYPESFTDRFFGPADAALRQTIPWRLLTAPWDMTVLPDDVPQGYYMDLGPLLLGLAFSLLLAWRAFPQEQRKVAAMLLTFSAAFYAAFWLYCLVLMIGWIQARFLVPILAVLSVLLAAGLEALSAFDRPQFSIRRFLLLAVALVAGLQLISTGVRFLKEWPVSYIVGVESREDYLHRRLTTNYEAIAYVNQQTEPGAFVYCLWEPRSYYFERRVYPDLALDNLSYLVYRYKSAEQIARHWREIGVTHLLFNESGFQFIRLAGAVRPTVADEEVLKALQEDYLQPVYRDGRDYVIYELRPEESERPVK